MKPEAYVVANEMIENILGRTFELFKEKEIERVYS